MVQVIMQFVAKYGGNMHLFTPNNFKKKRLNFEQNLYTLLQIISLSLFEKTPLNELFIKTEYKNQIAQDYNRLHLF